MILRNLGIGMLLASAIFILSAVTAAMLPTAWAWYEIALLFLSLAILIVIMSSGRVGSQSPGGMGDAYDVFSETVGREMQGTVTEHQPSRYDISSFWKTVPLMVAMLLIVVIMMR